MEVLVLAGAPGGIQESNEYLYLPLNETSGSRSKFGNYASSVTINNEVDNMTIVIHMILI